MYLVECTVVQWGTSVGGWSPTRDCPVSSILSSSKAIIGQSPWHWFINDIIMITTSQCLAKRIFKRVVIQIKWFLEVDPQNLKPIHLHSIVEKETSLNQSMHQCIASSQYGNWNAHPPCSFLWYSGTKQVLIRETFWQKWCWAVPILSPRWLLIEISASLL